MVNVVLADDEEFVRYFLKSVMESLSFNVVAEVEKGDELVNIMYKHQPDILLLDINMPNLTGIEFLHEYAKDYPNTCIIILTSTTSALLINEASKEGAKCFLRKDTPIEIMISSIETVWAEFKKERHV
jgi:DNA-binding NarL/FixJ family response regulator